ARHSDTSRPRSDGLIGASAPPAADDDAVLHQCRGRARGAVVYAPPGGHLDRWAVSLDVIPRPHVVETVDAADQAAVDHGPGRALDLDAVADRTVGGIVDLASARHVDGG